MIAVWCGDWLSEQELADAKLVTSELVSNAVVHGVGHIRLTTHLDESRLLIEVLDDGTGFERSAPEAAIPVDRPGGRGLVVVDQIASRWGIHKGSARAWAELERAG